MTAAMERAREFQDCRNAHNVEPETFFMSSYTSSLGTYTLVSSYRGVVCLESEKEMERRLTRWKHNSIRLQRDVEYNAALARELDAYFAGKLRRFTVPLDLRGTAFQLRVWEILCSIPYGVTRSYREVAQALGNPRATRAVGQAIGRNPVSIVVPCHRVVGSDGRLTGYGGGLSRKRALLDLESGVPPSIAV